MSANTETARSFFEACETGKGWDGCSAYCHADASFSAQSGVLLEINTLEGYAEWMKGLLTPIPDGHYELKFFAEDEERGCVAAFAVFHGTQTGPGGPPEMIDLNFKWTTTTLTITSPRPLRSPSTPSFSLKRKSSPSTKDPLSQQPRLTSQPSCQARSNRGLQRRPRSHRPPRDLSLPLSLAPPGQPARHASQSKS